MSEQTPDASSRLEQIRERWAANDYTTLGGALMDMAWLLAEVERLNRTSMWELMYDGAKARADRAEAALEAAGGPSTEYVDWVNERAEKAERLLVKSDYIINEKSAEVARRDKVLEAVRVVLAEWGMTSIDNTGFDEDFADAIHENGAWRLARDLRAALDTSEAPGEQP